MIAAADRGVDLGYETGCLVASVGGATAPRAGLKATTASLKLEHVDSMIQAIDQRSCQPIVPDEGLELFGERKAGRDDQDGSLEAEAVKK